MTAVAVIITALAVWGLLTTRHGLRLRHQVEASYKSGHRDGLDKAAANANRAAFDKLGRTPMSAETLRRAAERVRREGTAPAALGPDFNDPRLLALADWLEREANESKGWEAYTTPEALAVARAYLGETS